jgi:xanthine dehydrogenase large subunit
LSGFHALRDAIASVVDYAGTPALSAPATPERVLASVDALRAEAKCSAAARPPAPVPATAK